MNPFHVTGSEQNAIPFSANAVLREDLPARFEQIEQLLQNAPVLTERCPSVPSVMEDL